jgi:glutamate synthase domain-containing protein 1
MLTTAQLETFFPDLLDELFASAIGLVHSRFGTNPFPPGRCPAPIASSRPTARSTP